MTKNEFLETLKANLVSMPDNEVIDILSDYEEHFQIGFESGKTEEDICKDLGSPKNCANSYKAEYNVKLAVKEPSANNIAKAILSAVALSLFNIIFLVGPFVAILGVIIALWASAIAIGVSGVAVFIAGFFVVFAKTLIIADGVFLSFVICIFTGLGLVAFGGLFGIACYYISKGFGYITVKYIKWNIEIISNRRK